MAEALQREGEALWQSTRENKNSGRYERWSEGVVTHVTLAAAEGHEEGSEETT